MKDTILNWMLAIGFLICMVLVYVNVWSAL